MRKILFLIILVSLPSAVWISCTENKAATRDKNSAYNNEKIYALYKVKRLALGDTLRLPAQLSAFEFVSIYPKVTGYIKTIPVDIGTEVKQGQILMEMEAPEVEANNLAAEEKYIKAVASFSASKDSYFRLLNTSKTPGAVSPNDLQSAKAKMESDSALCNSEKDNWKAMESLKDYLIVRAPFDGIITQRNIHPGALVTVGTKTDGQPMLELQKVSKLRLQVKVPETYATQLKNNQKVNFIVDAIPGKTFTGIICRESNSLDDKYRSESVEMDVINLDKTLMPGMYAEVSLPLEGHLNACVVPQAAVVTSTENKFITKVHNHKADKIDVRTGNSSNGMIEVFGSVVEGDSVLTINNDEIKQGQTIY